MVKNRLILINDDVAQLETENFLFNKIARIFTFFGIGILFIMVIITTIYMENWNYYNLFIKDPMEPSTNFPLEDLYPHMALIFITFGGLSIICALLYYAQNIYVIDRKNASIQTFFHFIKIKQKKESFSFTSIKAIEKEVYKNKTVGIFFIITKNKKINLISSNKIKNVNEIYSSLIDFITKKNINEFLTSSYSETKTGLPMLAQESSKYDFYHFKVVGVLVFYIYYMTITIVNIPFIIVNFSYLDLYQLINFFCIFPNLILLDIALSIFMVNIIDIERIKKYFRKSKS